MCCLETIGSRAAKMALLTLLGTPVRVSAGLFFFCRLVQHPAPAVDCSLRASLHEWQSIVLYGAVTSITSRILLQCQLVVTWNTVSTAVLKDGAHALAGKRLPRAV